MKIIGTFLACAMMGAHIDSQRAVDDTGTPLIARMGHVENPLVANINYFDTLADLDDVGSLEIGDYVGARRRPARRGGRPAPRGRQIAARTLMPQVPGVPMPGARLQPLGLGATAFTASSGVTLSLSALPQRPFKGQRLILDVTRTGTTATGLVTVQQFLVGTNNQLVGAGALSANAFAATAFDANIAIDPATPGISIQVLLATTVAPSSSDRIDVGGTIFGTTVG